MYETSDSLMDLSFMKLLIVLVRGGACEGCFGKFIFWEIWGKNLFLS